MKMYFILSFHVWTSIPRGWLSFPLHKNRYKENMKFELKTNPWEEGIMGSINIWGNFFEFFLFFFFLFCTNSIN
jgi:hypothetical protein